MRRYRHRSLDKYREVFAPTEVYRANIDAALMVARV